MRLQVGRKYKGGRLAASKRWRDKHPNYQAERAKRKHEAAGTSAKPAGRPTKKRPNFQADLFSFNKRIIKAVPNFTLSKETGTELEFKIGKSKIHGFGLFTTCAIPAETVLMQYTGETITVAESDVREVRYKASNTDICMFGLANGSVIDATTVGNVACFVNLSCTPNVTSEPGENGDTIWIVALRDLKKGEEVTIDYMLQPGVKSIEI